MFYKEDCLFHSIWQHNWALMLFNVSYTTTAESWRIETLFYMFSLFIRTRQLNSVIMMRTNIYTDIYRNFVLFQIKQKISNIELANYISNWKASAKLKRNLIIWIKSNGSIYTALTFILCWWVIKTIINVN